jgi:nucleoporin GLE1
MLPSTKPQQPSTDPRVPAVCNGDKLPILLVYLLNQLSKAIIAQLITETGAKPDTATPLGLLVAQVFSLPDFSFRGATLIDILMAKYRVVCPVLWGISGNDKTNEGRARLGWWKEEDEFVTEEVHNSRMTGLGAGWAAICLRNFSKSKNKSPWPVWHYWQSLSLITSTPSAQASNTHYIVLKAMLEGSEKAFVNFYGSMAIMAMQIAMLHFPARAIKQTAASLSLTVLADKLLRDENFDLANYSAKKQGI